MHYRHSHYFSLTLFDIPLGFKRGCVNVLNRAPSRRYVGLPVWFSSYEATRHLAGHCLSKALLLWFKLTFEFRFREKVRWQSFKPAWQTTETREGNVSFRQCLFRNMHAVLNFSLSEWRTFRHSRLYLEFDWTRTTRDWITGWSWSEGFCYVPLAGRLLL